MAAVAHYWLRTTTTATPRRIPPAPAISAAPSAAPLLDVTAAADRLGTPVRFIRRLVAQRRIRHSKVGRYIRFDPADLDTWLTRTRIEPFQSSGQPS